MIDTGSRPLVTFVVLCYSQAEYVRQAIQAAFDQTYSPLEILVSDDGSTDDSTAIISEMLSTYCGPHSVRYNFNRINLGIGRHMNRVFELAQGELVVIAAADDVSIPERTERTVGRWLSADHRPSAIFCSALELQADGCLGQRHKVALGKGKITTREIVSYSGGGPVLLGACSAYSPEVMTTFDKLLPCLLVEDIPLAVRASLRSGILCMEEELVWYRTGASVWVPRKVQDEPFETHFQRLCRRSTANYMIAKQILLDVKNSADQATIRAAERRFLAAEYLVQTRRARRFLAFRFFRALIMASRWREPLVLAFLFAFPKFHRSVFRMHQWLTRLQGNGHD